jgi:hypothetical protein
VPGLGFEVMAVAVVVVFAAGFPRLQWVTGMNADVADA